MFSFDGSKIATVSGSVVHVWNAQNGERLLRLPHKDSVDFATFSPVEDKLLIVSGKKKIRIFDVQQGTPLMDPLVQKKEITSVSFSPDGTRLLVTDDHIGVIFKFIPAYTFDQALLVAMFNKDGAIPECDWATSVMDVYSPSERELIKKAFSRKPTVKEKIKKVGSYFSFGSSSSSKSGSNNNNNNNNNHNNNHN
jgi:WD40 repeat protein